MSTLYRECAEREYAEFASGTLAHTLHDPDEHAESSRFSSRLLDRRSRQRRLATWSLLLAARAEGIGGVLTTVLRYEEEQVMQMLGVRAEAGWQMNARARAMNGADA
ncbi:hypothetical protein [Pseudonocardia alaniniphila]|uniref:Uncharacterized protein n=1 Tax=Pseudonocardia alaniniphila TaxID=75291 RepID=A0ABS9TVP8_9PSEU|nr:hypothetical protein [Pseudonocardia alaniniphila]MCH6172311.1 hypothetical protein [Pseudonocardia alaniniphila]